MEAEARSDNLDVMFGRMIIENESYALRAPLLHSSPHRRPQR
jgi:hypothetical protein